MSADKDMSKDAASKARTAAKKVSDTADKAAHKAAGKASDAADEAHDSVQHFASEAWNNGEALFNDASQLVANLRQGQGELGSRLTSGAQSRPYLAAGAAMGLGFILGGGLTLGITRRLVAVGGRFALSMVARKVMENATKMAT